MDPQQWQRIKDTFGVIVEQPPARRAAVLHELCAGDDELRREVESLLASHDETGYPIPADGFDVPARLNLAAVDYAGRSFGPYRIIREIGRGGMGTVFLAERADGEFHRQVALKVVRRSLADRELERRFRRERQILASLNHRHIAHLLDGGVSADGEPFFVMEYVEGVRIDEYCARTSQPPRERLKLFLSVCRAVAYAHEQKVIHRDLKPSNVLVTADGVPKLLDFGIAKLLDTSGAGDQTVTEFRAFTPDYAAPEQLRGEQPLTPATDVFSLGVLLSVLLDRASVIKPDSALTPTPPDQTPGTGRGAASARARNPALGRELQNIIAMARHDEPERRYQSANELALDIERHLRGLPVLAQPDTIRYRAAKFIGRRKAFLAASVAGAVVTGVIGATFYATLDNDRPGAAVPGTFGPSAPGSGASSPLLNVRTIAVLPLRSFVAASPQPAASRTSERIDDQALRVGMADSIVTKLSQVRQLTVRPTSATVRYLDQDYEAVEVGRELQVDSVLEGTLQQSGDELRANLQLVDVATGNVVWADSLTTDLANVLRGQESLANRVSQLLALNLAAGNEGRRPQGSANLDAQDAYLRGLLAMATSLRQVSNIFAARDAFEQAIRLDPDFAPAQAGLANAYTLAGSLTLLAPQDSYPKAERAARRALAIDPDLAGAYIALAEIEADYNWNWAAAEANNLRALELAPNSSSAHHSYSELLARLGRFAESGHHSDLALQLDPTRVNYVAVRALHYYYEHRFAEAVAQAQKALAQDQTTYLAYIYLAVAQARLGNYAAGIEAARQASALTGGAVPDTFVLGYNYALMNDRANAEAIAERLREMGRGRYVDPFHFVAIYAYLGDKARAFEYLEQSYAERSYWMTSLRVHPVVNSLRGDPRFEEMLRRMHLD